MLTLLLNGVPFCFYALFFFVPLVLYPTSSELFEFNKMMAVYILTVAIMGFWLAKMIFRKKVIFRRTIFDIPLLVFVFSQFISTVTSIDFRTSLLGYYSRFHGGFLSYFCYSLLFWAYIANMDKGKTIKALRFLLSSAVLVSLYGVLEHFGIDKDLWVQDVTSRVFSTLGQPNWLAAWLVAIVPISWAVILTSEEKIINAKKHLFFFLISALYFLTILYTKSRSGILAFVLVSLLFWGPILFLYIKRLSLKNEIFRKFLILNVLFLIIFLLTPTPYFSGLSGFLFKKEASEIKSVGPALEVGGTESGIIRKIVWKGALDIWKHYPILGTGVETFAYSYYQFRPIEHNLVSEWDFLYNKAHNELLNFAANTGIVGLGSYLFFIGTIIYYLVKRWKRSFFHLAFLSGIIGLEVSNFFGFSVVPTSLLLFLYPAMAISFTRKHTLTIHQERPLSFSQKSGLAILLFVAAWTLMAIGKYWLADLNYSYGKSYNASDDFVNARKYLSRAVKLSPKEAIFWDELSETDAEVAVALSEDSQKEQAQVFADAAIEESKNAVLLSPRNINIKRNRASTYIKLSALDSGYLEKARDLLLEAVTFAPTEAKLFYNLGLTYLRLGDYDGAIKTLEKTVHMKPNYRDARLALALSLIDIGEKTRAKEELNYILEKIEPDDAISRQTLEEIK